MRLLLCSDIHTDLAAARRLVEQSTKADVLVVAGDLAVMRTGLQKTVDVLATAPCPAVLVAGNGESTEELVAACARWSNAHVLHGTGCEIDGVTFWAAPCPSRLSARGATISRRRRPSPSSLAVHREECS
jgi:Icc-related predicted phosphoesterase